MKRAFKQAFKPRPCSLRVLPKNRDKLCDNYLKNKNERMKILKLGSILFLILSVTALFGQKSNSCWDKWEWLMGEWL
jgi:hypothetical protein